MNFLFTLGYTYHWSEYYYDKTTDTFIEDKFHETNLDPQTIHDGRQTISDKDLWNKIVEFADENAASKYLELRTVEDEKEEINLDVLMNLGYRIISTDTTIVVCNQASQILCVISKGAHFWIYLDPHLEKGKKGFNTFKETFDYMQKRIQA